MSATVTVSTSVILAPTKDTAGNYIVYFPNISTNGRLITVRDNDGYASTNHAVVLSTIGGAQFQTGVDTTNSQIYINQPFGFITLNSQTSGRYTILNTFAFPEGSAAAFVSKVTTNNLVTSTLQMIDIGTQSTNTFFTSTGFMYLNSTVMGQVSQQQLTSTVTGLGTAGYISTIIIPPISPALYVATGFSSNQTQTFAKDPLGSIIYSVGSNVGPWTNATSGYSYGFSNGGNDVVMGGPYIVAVGDSYSASASQSYIQVSIDGCNWNYANAYLSSQQVRLRTSFANGLYHAVGSNGSNGGVETIMWSRDAYTWNASVVTPATTAINPFPNGYARGITYGNGRWVVVGSQSFGNAQFSVLNSTDGSNWSPGSVVQAAAEPFWDVGFNGTQFLALCGRTTTSNGNILRSSDGVNWSNLPNSYASSNFKSDSNFGGYIAGYASTWLVTSSNNAPSGQMLWRSADNGDTWSAVPFFNSGKLSRPYWDGALWWVGYYNPLAPNGQSMYYSLDDGINWSSNFIGMNSFQGGFAQGFASRGAQSNFASALLSTVISLSSNQSISSLQTNVISTNSITAATMTVSSLFVQVEVISTSFETINSISTITANNLSAGTSYLTQAYGSSLQISTLGIRTANPQYALDVVGKGRFTDDILFNSTIYIGDSNSITTGKLRILTGYSGGSDTYIQSGTVSGGGNLLKIGQLQNTNTTMTVDTANYRVGINCNSPQYNLDVQNTIRCTSNFIVGYSGDIGSFRVDSTDSQLPEYPLSTRVSFGGGVPGVGWQMRIAANFEGTMNDIITVSDHVRVGINQIDPQYTLDVNGDIRCTNIITTGGTVFITGMMMIWSTGTAPTGWLLCDGASYSTTGPYASLFAVIGYTYGGSGLSFNVPDTRGRTGIGAGTGPGLTNRVLAAKGGAETHTLTIPQLPKHTHSITDEEHFHRQVNTIPGGGGLAAADGGNGNRSYYDSYPNTDPAFTGITGTNETGGDNAHNNMQPFIVINYIIKI